MGYCGVMVRVVAVTSIFVLPPHALLAKGPSSVLKFTCLVVHAGTRLFQCPQLGGERRSRSLFQSQLADVEFSGTPSFIRPQNPI